MLTKRRMKAGDEEARDTITRVKQCKWRRSITREKKAESHAHSIASTMYGMARKEGRKKKTMGIKWKIRERKGRREKYGRKVKGEKDLLLLEHMMNQQEKEEQITLVYSRVLCCLSLSL